MKSLKKGNVTLMLFPIGVMLLITILISIAFLYIQVIVRIHDIKTNLFYIVSSSIQEDILGNLAYRDYTFDSEIINEKINILLHKNYLKEDYSNGLIDIECEGANLIKNKDDIIKHTNGKYTAPIICVNIRVVFRPIISIIGDRINIKIHDDIKFNLLEFSG